MSLLTRIDDFVLDKIVQPIVNKTGIDPAAAARSLYIGNTVFIASDCMFEYGSGALSAWEAALAAVAIVFSFGMAKMQPDTPSNGALPAWRLMLRPYRIFGVLMVVPLIVTADAGLIASGKYTAEELVTTVGCLMYHVALFLSGCRMPPPKPVTERKTGFAHAGTQ